MSSVATGASAGSVPVRLSPEQRARINNSSAELERFVDQHGGLEWGSQARKDALLRWYGGLEAPTPVQTEQERQAARLARLIRCMPDGLTPDEQTAWIAVAEASL